jgi:glycosyltransferase involved in cell wall biosynthesis
VDFSIIIPTYERRDLVASTVRALARQEYFGAFEVIVVVDGSADGSAQALRTLHMPFPLTVLEQTNQGIAAARNRGAAVATGDWLLFLDDDMEADRHLLAEHARSHQSGADAVTGHVPLHPGSPANFLSDSVKAWAEERAKALRSVTGSIDFLEVVGGQLSISRKLFTELNGFDTNFTRRGTFGNEDRDLACRLLTAGRRIVFNPDAISWQTYIVRPRRFLRNYRQAGGADVRLAVKHPDRAARIFNPECVETRMDRLVWRWFRRPASTATLAFLERGKEYPWCVRVFWWVWKMEYSQGAREARRAEAGSTGRCARS